MTSQPAAAPPRRFPPQLTSRWWSVVLVLSLALNLLIAAAAAARFYFPPPPDRFMGSSYTQLVPRRFLSDLDQPRREELLSVFRQYRDEVRTSRKEARAAATRLADALEAEPYDAARVESAVADFARTGSDLINHGSKVALDFVARLSAEERRRLAHRLRERAEHGRIN